MADSLEEAPPNGRLVPGQPQEHGRGNPPSHSSLPRGLLPAPQPPQEAALSSIPHLCSQRDWRQTKGRRLFCYQDTKSLHLIKTCHGNQCGACSWAEWLMRPRAMPTCRPFVPASRETTPCCAFCECGLCLQHQGWKLGDSVGLMPATSFGPVSSLGWETGQSQSRLGPTYIS